jgi:hypothetical protein
LSTDLSKWQQQRMEENSLFCQANAWGFYSSTRKNYSSATHFPAANPYSCTVRKRNRFRPVIHSHRQANCPRWWRNPSEIEILNNAFTLPHCHFSWKSNLMSVLETVLWDAGIHALLGGY